MVDAREVARILRPPLPCPKPAKGMQRRLRKIKDEKRRKSDCPVNPAGICYRERKVVVQFCFFTMREMVLQLSFFPSCLSDMEGI